MKSVCAAWLGIAIPAAAQTPDIRSHQTLVQRYCFGCHNNQVKTAGVTLQGLDLTTAGSKAELLERVLRKIKSSQMPPAGAPRPNPTVTTTFTRWLEGALDAEAAARPNPGRPSVHRLNRAEYGNAVRDLLLLDVNAGALLPVDDSGYGFDNIGDVLSVSPLLLDRYLSVARKISRMAIGDLTIKPIEEAFETRRDGNRASAPVPARLERVSDDLPFNSAGGVSTRYYFPVDAEYALRINFSGPNSPSTKKPIELRVPIKAGLHTVGFTFPRQSIRPELLSVPASQGQTPSQPPSVPVPVDLRLDGVALQRSTIPGVQGVLPRVASLSIAGPYNPTGPGDTPSRRAILVCRPDSPAKENSCAEQILSKLARRAYRRSVTAADVRPLLAFYQQARLNGSFEYGIQKAIEAILVSPDFLFRVEADTVAKAGSNGVRRLDGVELASRLSFFLWSSIPDEELLELGVNGKLADAAVMKSQIQRMLDDPKANSLVSNLAGQWLQIRNLATVKPDPVVFADFDESLRASMQRETELFFESILRENRSATDLLSANYTFLNERLARHYGIPKIYGSQFRRVELRDVTRGGLLGHASLLTVTSPPNRTSVVQRGKWVLDNLLGAPPPPPPPDVPALEATTKGSQKMSLRAALELHRASPGCAGCHAVMDPIGFALENYDGIGRWRTEDGGSAIDASGKLPDGTQFTGPKGLKDTLSVARREEFLTAFAERLLTYALGRGLEYYDQPAVRAIVRETAPAGNRVRDLVTSVVMSTPFQMRRSENP